jgi:uncharacterized protein YndB with AHSA1/START domain
MSIIGTMSRIDDTRGTVRMEDVYDTDQADLWDAVTDPARLSRWMATFDAQPGLGVTVAAEFTSGWEGPLRVDVCDAPSRLIATLEPGTDEETVIEAVLSAEGERTRLIVEERGLPLDRIAAHGAGWQAHLEDLARSLRGDGSRWHDRWQELSADYRAREVVAG